MASSQIRAFDDPCACMTAIRAAMLEMLPTSASKSGGRSSFVPCEHDLN